MAIQVQQTRVSASWESGKGCLKGLPTFVEDTVLRKDKDCLLRRGWGISPLSSWSCGGLRGWWGAAGPQGGRNAGRARARGQWGLLVLPICGQGPGGSSVSLLLSVKWGVGVGGWVPCLLGTSMEGNKWPRHQKSGRGLQRRQVEKMGWEVTGGVR